jgi:hypothetical protein
LPAELVEGPEDPHEDVLREVERVVTVAQQVERELVDHALVLGNQFGTGGLVALRTPGHQRRLAPLEFVPGASLGGFDQEFLGHRFCSDYSKTTRARPASVLFWSIGHRIGRKVSRLRPSGFGAASSNLRPSGFGAASSNLRPSGLRRGRLRPSPSELRRGC